MTDPYKLNQYLNRVEAAKILGVTPLTLKNWEKTKKHNIKMYKHPVSGYPLYLKEDLYNFLKNIK
jgi:hypothetical protein